ncbi:roadblock/LC7 domain-containing protein [Pseudomonas oryzae]|uniref:hypothetical protein n=1 Tax=Pseudomonas oryzae TaxID=1392877 RepID=UPI0012FE7DE1|nr:hypothetical protein [Pseudomonas oryzae]
MDHLSLGRKFHPHLEKMAKRIPNLRFVVLATLDGFNICSLGLTESQVGKMASLSGSLFSIGEAIVEAVHNAGPSSAGENLELQTFEAGRLQVVNVRLHGSHPQLVMMIGATAPLGVVLVGVRATIHEIKTTITPDNLIVNKA